MIDHRFFELVDQLHSVPSADGLTDLLTAFASKYGLAHAVYLGVNLRQRREDLPFVAYTYPETWADHYRAQNYINTDPLVQAAATSLLPLDWADHNDSRPLHRRIFQEAQSFGLGNRGLSLSTRGRRGEVGLMSITMHESDRAWDAFKASEMGTLQIVAAHMHQAVLRMQGVTILDVRLSTRERDCLRWAAEGKSFADIATILGIGERTARTYLDSARQKLGCINITHAVAKAISQNLIPHPSD